MRNALSMTQKNLAKLLNSNIATVSQTEKRETTGKVTLDTLRKIANAMECELIYAFVPKKEIKSILRQKALEKAEIIVRQADTHMTLEDQKVENSLRKRVERLADKLIAKGDVW